MSKLMEYDHEMTRVLYRSIAGHDNIRLMALHHALQKIGGVIGNAFFVDLVIEDEKLFCEQHRIRGCNYENKTAEEIDTDARCAWDADGVWIPAGAGEVLKCL